jgi:hypothetical protein
MMRQPYRDRTKVLARHWAEYGFGAPKINASANPRAFGPLPQNCCFAWKGALSRERSLSRLLARGEFVSLRPRQGCVEHRVLGLVDRRYGVANRKIRVVLGVLGVSLGSLPVVL